MSEKEQKKTKITSGSPAGQSDDARHNAKHDDAKAKDENKAHGGAHKKKADESSGIAIKGSVNFLRDVAREAKKITWPPRSQVMQETWSVIVLVAFITVMVLGFDYALGNWVFGPIEHLAKVLAPQTAEQGMFSQTPIDSSSPTPVPQSEAPPVTPGTTAPLPPTTPSGATEPVPAPTQPGATAPAAPVTTPPPGTTPATTTAPQATPPAPAATPSPTSTTPTPAAPTAPQGTAPAAPPTSTPAPASTPTTPRP